MIPRLPLAITLLLLAAATAMAGQVKILRIVDGDTVSVSISGKATSIRLDGIDAPEREQPYAEQSAALLKKLCGAGMCDFRQATVDRYKRPVGTLICKGVNVNLEMVKQGAAWWFRKYSPKNKVLQRAEAASRKAKKGLWAKPAIAPWDWRGGGKVKEVFSRRQKGAKGK